MDKAPTFVGIDVSKHRLDIHARPSGEHFTIDHDEQGVAALVERLVALALTGRHGDRRVFPRRAACG